MCHPQAQLFKRGSFLYWNQVKEWTECHGCDLNHKGSLVGASWPHQWPGTEQTSGDHGSEHRESPPELKGPEWGEPSDNPPVHTHTHKSWLSGGLFRGLFLDNSKLVPRPPSIYPEYNKKGFHLI